jgi:hypothetical protein
MATLTDFGDLKRDIIDVGNRESMQADGSVRNFAEIMDDHGRRSLLAVKSDIR